ncbi:acyltransferase [Microbacterium memoriense]|uniref:Acyltransferase n=1 Tax=Microbacterium memoriense TaxID=2978350 RepID=A0ABT2PBG5_9MICO|nr:acyltransferase [Microbacterium memoriense]MCT9001923.1 acyltransferase [Microbacterium memoriense]
MDAAKSFSILLVVLVHVEVELAFIEAAPSWLQMASVVFAPLRMPLFFAASGLFAYKWTQASWTELFDRKISLLAWVFLVWQPVVFMYKVIETEVLPNQPSNTIADQVLKFLVAPIRPNGELWFLWALCLFFIAGRALKRISTKVVVVASAAVSVAAMVGIPALPPEVNRLLGAGWAGVPMYFFFFIAAARLSKRILSIVTALNWWQSALLTLPWVALTLVASLFPDSAILLHFPASIFAVAAGFGVARLVERLSLFSYLGQRTLPIYVAHIAVIVLVVSTLHLVHPGSWAWAWIGDVLVPVALWVVAIWVPLVIHHFARRQQYGRYLYESPAGFLRGWPSLGRRIRGSSTEG